MTRERTVAELADIVGGEVVRGDRGLLVRAAASIADADAGAVAALWSPHYLPALRDTRASAVILERALLERGDLAFPTDLAVIAVDNARAGLARAATELADEIVAPAGVHPWAVIDPTATVAPDASIGPFVLVGARAVIGSRVVLHAGVHVEAGAEIGEQSVLFNHVVVRTGCTIGRRVTLHAGVVIGSDGFGFVREDRSPGEPPHHVGIPHHGDVVVEDDVRIGANSCVDRATFGTTRIGAGTKIDNLVQVGHNADIGPGCIVVAQAGIAGSTRLGRGVTLAAQAGVAGHLSIGDDATVLGQSGVRDDLPAKSVVVGTPAVPKREFVRTLTKLRNLDELARRLEKLEASEHGAT